MQSETNAKRKRGSLRLWLVLAAVAALIAVLLLSRSLEREEQQRIAEQTALSVSPSTAQTLVDHLPEDVVSIAVSYPDEPSWTVVQTSAGLLELQGEDGFTLSAATSESLLSAAASFMCEEVLTENPADYADHLADFGLETPGRTAVITYADGQVVTLYVGDRAPHTAAWHYMLMAGDDRLFGLGVGTVDALFLSRESLREVQQPTIHRARIDRLTLRSGDGSVRAEWALAGEITDADALDRWTITAPFRYPADPEAMSSLLKNVANLRLGAYVAPATEDNLALYGFDAPRQVIEIHMATGTMGSTGADGVYATQDWPEAAVTFTIGGARSDMVDYVRYGDDIYVCSHFTMGSFITVDPRSTMSAYPLPTALGNLASLQIETESAVTEYVVHRTEQVAENNDLMTDEDGNVLYVYSLTRNGEAASYEAFSAAYERLMITSVSGLIPEAEIPDNAPYITYTFTDVNGTVHVIGLHAYTALHDAVSVDGHIAYYLEKGAFSLDLE